MDPGVPDVAFDRWWHAMRDVAATKATSLAWRQHRYKFAHTLVGELVRGLRGPAVYGVWPQWGLLYVGQTLEAERRLKDLVIGESHHLANTYPPEMWRWVAGGRPEEQPLARRSHGQTVGRPLRGGPRRLEPG